MLMFGSDDDEDEEEKDEYKVKDEEEKDDAAPFTPIKRPLSRMPFVPSKKLKGGRDGYASAD